MDSTAREVSELIHINLGFLQFNQRARKILGVQKKDRLTVSANHRLTIAYDTRTIAKQTIPGGEDIVHFEAKVVDSACRIAFQKTGDGGVCA